MAQRLTFECWNPDHPGDPTYRWNNIRRTGEVWWADFCPVCRKQRRSIGCEEIPDPKTPEQLRQEELIEGALF